MPRPIPQPSDVLFLDEAAACLKEGVDRFVADWRRENAASPQDWPESLTFAEWQDQFEIFSQLGAY